MNCSTECAPSDFQFIVIKYSIRILDSIYRLSENIEKAEP